MRVAAASAGVLSASIAWSREHLRSSLLAAGFSGCLLLSCTAVYPQKVSSPLRSTPHIPLPKQALLEPPKEPDCTVKTSGGKSEDSRAEASEPVSTVVANLAPHGRSDASKGAGSSPPASETAPQPRRVLVEADPKASLSLRIKLEYERDCFQRAEMRVRESLLQLQKAIAKTIRAVKRVRAEEAALSPP